MKDNERDDYTATPSLINRESVLLITTPAVRSYNQKAGDEKHWRMMMKIGWRG
jgi:hypothetical protein